MGAKHSINLILANNRIGKVCSHHTSTFAVYFLIMKHGMIGTRIYNIWHDMKRRCYCKSRKSYARYGGRGITVCPEWQEFMPFYDWAMANGYSDNLTIDRIDVNGNYEPSNCRWVTSKEQANNKRNNHMITHNGKTQTITQWADELEINESTLHSRISRGFSCEKVLTMPKGCRRKSITFNGQTKTVKEWSEYTGIKYRTLSKRIYELHWNIERALTTK